MKNKCMIMTQVLFIYFIHLIYPESIILELVSTINKTLNSLTFVSFHLEKKLEPIKHDICEISDTNCSEILFKPYKNQTRYI